MIWWSARTEEAGWSISIFNYLGVECVSVGQVILHTLPLSHKRLYKNKPFSKVILYTKMWLCRSKIGHSQAASSVHCSRSAKVFFCMSVLHVICV